jgi:hypothetical protein
MEGVIDSVLPPLYQRWLVPLLGDIPTEPKATCSDCAMCDTPERKAFGAYPFRPDVKCCVYEPDLPNFLVGRILADDTQPHGQRTVRQRIARRVAATPLGVDTSPSFRLMLEKSNNAIGRSLKLRCPHFVEETQGCGIYNNRNHLCSTWWCKHERGLIGYSFWQVLKRFLKALESDLANWCLLEIGIEAHVLNLLHSRAADSPRDSSEMENTLSDHAYAAHWGQFVGREEELYGRCAELVEALTPEQVLEHCGPATKVHLEVVRAAYQNVSTKALPATLRTGSYQLHAVGADGIAAVTYSSLDPIAVPAPVLSVLHMFDGRPTAEIFQQIAHERGLELEADLIQELVDWGILV